MTDDTKQNDRTVDQPQDDVTGQVAEMNATAVADLEASPPGGTPVPERGDDDPHANLAAFLLDALPEDERAAFAAHYATCEVCQQEAAELAPVMGSLPGLLVFEPTVDLQSPEISPLPADLAPSPGLRDQLLAAVRAEPTAAAEQPVEIVPETPSVDETQPGDQQATAAEPIPITTRRPPGRILPGSSAGATSVTSQAWQTVSRVSWASRLAAVFAIVAVGAMIWALALQGRVNDLEDENESLEQTIARIESSAGATVAFLDPAGQGPADSSGEFFFSLPDQEGWIIVDGMNQLPSGQAYQLWYIRGEEAPRPGPTIPVGEDGTGVAQVASDAPSYTTLAVTVEPEGGSEAPTSDPVLLGNLSGAAG